MNVMAATAPVGVTSGQLEVTTRGSARYTIPVVIPPGTRGMQPKLTLGYDSQAGNGFIGHGWSLGGLSVIHRCGATILLDGFKGGVKYDANDKFCLDGERLVNVGGNEYRTRHETWQRIIASDTTANPASFTVWAKDGYILEFGVTEDSRIQAQGSASVRVWALNKMMDRVGNYYTIQYQEDNANGDYRPDRIDYTGNAYQGLNPYNSVVFQYEARTDTPPRYEAGSVIKAMQRLTHVLSYTDNGNTLVRDYRLTYDPNGAASRSRLTSVQECGTDGVCLPATQFGWQNGAISYASTPAQFYWSTNKADSIGFADIDGDGQLDFYGWGADGNIHVRRWGPAGFGSETLIPWSANNYGGLIGFADINGDGRADFWGWRSDGNIYMRLSNGDGTFASAIVAYWGTDKNNIGFADIDGDGRADLYGYNSFGSLVVKLGNGDGTFGADVITAVPGGADNCYSGPCGTKNAFLRFADINNDGHADLVGDRDDWAQPIATTTCPTQSGVQLYSRFQRNSFARISLGNGSFGAEYPVMSWYAYMTSDGYGQIEACYEQRPHIGDVNGDGNADVFAWLSKADGGFVAPPTSFFPTTGGSIPAFSGMADVNGDGKDDYYYWWPANGNIYVRLSNGDNSFPTGFSIFWSTNANDKPVGFADINGDGIADLYGWSSDGNIQVKLANPVMPDLITSVTNGLGEQRQLAYKPLTDETTHVPAPVQTYPYRAVQDATYVVRATDKSDGLGGVATTYYRYAGQLRHVTAGERLGFNWIQRWEPDGSWVNDFYIQDVNLFGTLRESQTYVPGGVMVKHITNDWRLGASEYNRILARLFGSTEETYELNGNLINRTTTTTDYDGKGYPLTTTVEQLDGRKKKTVNTYLHDETYWTLGLKTLEQVTAEAPGFAPETRTTDYGYYTGLGLLAWERTEPTDSAYTLSKDYSYSILGNRTKTKVSGTNITARSTTYAYDSTGRFRTRTTNALGHYETLEYDPRNGQPTKHTGPNGLITTWSYDGLGRKDRETRPDGTNTTYTYSGCDATCPALAVTMTATAASGAGTTWAYRDILGREVRKQTQGFGGNWIYKDTQYDNLGRAAKVSLPYFSGETPFYTISEYDALQRVYRVTAPGNRVTTTAYNGLTTTATNPKNQTLTAVKDSEGHVVEVIDAASGHTRSTYDAFGNSVQVTGVDGAVTSMTYDRRGRKTAMIDPDRGNWTYEYNVLDELIFQTDANGQTTAMSYDKLGRMSTRTAPDTISTWRYDTAAYGKGKLAAIYDGNATENYVYDSLSRLSSSSTSISGIAYTTGYTYDAYSRLLTLAYPETGFQLYHVYDPYGHLTEVHQDTATGLRYWKADTYDAHGHLTQETLGNGVISQRAYDPATGDLQTIQTGPYASASVQNSSFTFDALDNLMSRSWFDGTAVQSETFGYDNLNRLKTVTGPANKTYSYYPNGNIRYKSDVGFYSYNGPQPHAVSQVGGYLNTLFTYDANGNMTSGNGRTITYYSFNKPSTVTLNGTTSLTYDANFNRLIKTNSSGTTTYIGKLYERAEGTSTVQRHFLYAGNNLVGMYVKNSNNTTATNYFHTDHLGSVDTVTNSSGTVTNRYGYDASGKRRYANGSDTSIYLFLAGARKGYTGHEHDDEVGLINMKAREYDPYLGRFFQPDPKGTQGDPHPYAYAYNNPLKYIDPTGTSSLTWQTQEGANWYAQQRQTWDMQDSYNASLTSSYMPSYSSFTQYSSSSVDNWSLFNTSSSLSSSGSGGLAQTSYNSSYNSGGYGGYVSPYASIGSGFSTGTPDSAIPFVNAFQYAANGNLGSALGSAAWDFATIFAPTRLLGMGAEAANIGRAARATERALVYPPNRGFAAGEGCPFCVLPGQVVDRYGASSGSFLSPQGTSWAARSLPQSSANLPLNSYEVLKPFEANAGRTAPWFGQPGGGIQYDLGTRTVDDLITEGYLR